MRKIVHGTLLAAALATCAGILPAQAGDAKRGEDVFLTNCADCHSTRPGGRQTRGPTLQGVVGRKGATLPGYSFSDASRAVSLTWTPETLTRYLRAPRTAVPGTTMKFDGLSSARDIDDLVAFLATLR